jgi:cyclopropane-fatty-acyl-phospholipid synthase
MVDTENLRPHYAQTLVGLVRCAGGPAGCRAARRCAASAGSQARAERILRAYRLYLAGSAMSFERGWIALHQMLSTRPSSAQSAYPFNRSYMYV